MQIVGMSKSMFQNWIDISSGRVWNLGRVFTFQINFHSYPNKITHTSVTHASETLNEIFVHCACSKC
jgi:hypothetical protein